MGKNNGNILIVDDDKDVLLSARLLLKRHFEAVRTVGDPRELPRLMAEETFDVILLDMNFHRDATSGREGFEWLERILAADPTVVVILVTAYGDVEMAVRAMKQGAADFILKPWRNEQLVATISMGMRLRTSRMEVDRLRYRQKQLSDDLDSPFHEMIGACSAMKRVFGMIEKVGSTDAGVLILGENGTGKELVARALHRRSPRAQEVFIAVDMGAISESLFESEMFGHEKGAFTDARESRAGRFEVASGGTLFLDEISNLSPAMQAKLLRVLEDRRVYRLGSNKPRSVDIRLVCATNADIYDLVDRKAFRQDLVFRINTVEIHLPPLRQRGDDIGLLTNHFLARYAAKYNKPVDRVSASAMKKLRSHSWPGNIRELRHAIERAIIMSDKPVLDAGDFLFPENRKQDRNFHDLNLDSVEKDVIQQALVKYGGNITHAARELGLTRAALYRRLSKHGL